jgi:hypothetical protein
MEMAISSLISVQSSRNIDIWPSCDVVARRVLAIKPNAGKRAVKKFYDT